MNDGSTNNSPSFSGRGLWGWLGRQVGYVKKALGADVGARVIYRQSATEEAAHPGDPKLTLRRTVTDEVVARCEERSEKPHG